jgi:hypothetical protein
LRVRVALRESRTWITAVLAGTSRNYLRPIVREANLVLVADVTKIVPVMTNGFGLPMRTPRMPLLWIV